MPGWFPSDREERGRDTCNDSRPRGPYTASCVASGPLEWIPRGRWWYYWQTPGRVGEAAGSCCWRTACCGCWAHAGEASQHSPGRDSPHWHPTPGALGRWCVQHEQTSGAGSHGSSWGRATRRWALGVRTVVSGCACCCMQATTGRTGTALGQGTAGWPCARWTGGHRRKGDGPGWQRPGWGCPYNAHGTGGSAAVGGWYPVMPPEARAILRPRIGAWPWRWGWSSRLNPSEPHGFQHGFPRKW